MAYVYLVLSSLGPDPNCQAVHHPHSGVNIRFVCFITSRTLQNQPLALGYAIPQTAFLRF